MTKLKLKSNKTQPARKAKTQPVLVVPDNFEQVFAELRDIRLLLSEVIQTRETQQTQPSNKLRVISQKQRLAQPAKRAKRPSPAAFPFENVARAWDDTLLAEMAACVQQNHAAGTLNEKIADACAKRGRPSDVRQWLGTKQNRMFKDAYKAAGLTLDAADDALNAMFD